MHDILRNPQAESMADLGVVDMLEFNVSEALGALHASDALLARLPEALRESVTAQLLVATQALDAILADLAPTEPPAAPSAVALNVPRPLAEDELLVLMRAA